MPLSGIGLAYATAGGILVWSGIKGETIAQTVGQLAKGQQPTGANTEGITVASSPSTAAGGGGGGGSVAPPATGGKYSYGQLKTLWVLAGGALSLAPTMAAIALAESGGDINAHNPSGASGLWQIEIPVNAWAVPGGASNVYTPIANARAAVAVERAQGLGAWTTYTSGAYRAFMQGLSLWHVALWVARSRILVVLRGGPGTGEKAPPRALLAAASPPGRLSRWSYHAEVKCTSPGT